MTTMRWGASADWMGIFLKNDSADPRTAWMVLLEMFRNNPDDNRPKGIRVIWFGSRYDRRQNNIFRRVEAEVPSK